MLKVLRQYDLKDEDIWLLPSEKAQLLHEDLLQHCVQLSEIANDNLKYNTTAGNTPTNTLSVPPTRCQRLEKLLRRAEQPQGPLELASGSTLSLLAGHPWHCTQCSLHRKGVWPYSKFCTRHMLQLPTAATMCSPRVRAGNYATKATLGCKCWPAVIVLIREAYPIPSMPTSQNVLGRMRTGHHTRSFCGFSTLSR